MQTLNTIGHAFKRMPFGLKIIGFFCLIFTMFAPAAFMPFGAYHIGGEVVTVSQFWHRGGGPIFLGFGFACGVLLYGFIHARQWARILLFPIWWGTLLAANACAGDWPAWDDWAVLIPLTAFVAWYLFFRPTVKRYFSEYASANR